MSKVTTTLKQKILLIALGFLFSFAFLEIGLRIGGLIFTSFQERGNSATFQGNEVRILCIGDSMTALGEGNSYPSQLEKFLNSKNRTKNFNIINKGIVGGTSTMMLSQLEENLDKYRPSIVISMLGVNDHYRIQSPNAIIFKFQNWLGHLRTFHLLDIATQHLKNKINESKLHANKETFPEKPSKRQDISDTLLNIQLVKQLESKYSQLEHSLQTQTSPSKTAKIKDALSQIRREEILVLSVIGRDYRVKENYTEALKFLKIALGLDPHNPEIYVEIGRCYKDQKQYPQAMIFLKQAKALGPQTVLADMELAHCYEALGQNEEAFKIYESTFKKKNPDLQINSNIGGWLLKNNHYQEAAVVLNEAIQDNPTDHALYDQLAEIYQKLGDKNKANYFSQRGREIKKDLEQFLPTTIHNYNEIAKIVGSRGIKLICMQYPLRSIDPLREIFIDNRSIDFIENKKSFVEALKNSLYSEIFTDSFGGDFGHCTPKGNRLIAENVADEILKIVSSK